MPELREALRAAGLDIPETGRLSSRMPEEEDRETALYRWYDEDSLLLYIGVSGNLSSRTKGHIKGSSWIDFAARSAIERHPNRAAALAAERTAIKTEGPLFNSQHNSPEARERAAKYLAGHGRLDLLAQTVPDLEG